MSETQKTLSDFTLPKMKLICRECDRSGRYDLERLKARFGRDAAIGDVIESLVGYCVERRRGRCRAGCDDLIWMFSKVPKNHHALHGWADPDPST